MEQLFEEAKRKQEIARLESIRGPFDPFLRFLAFETSPTVEVDCPGHAEYVKNLVTGMHEGWIAVGPMDAPSPEEIAARQKAMSDLIESTLALVKEQEPKPRPSMPFYRQLEMGNRAYPKLGH